MARDRDDAGEGAGSGEGAGHRAGEAEVGEHHHPPADAGRLGGEGVDSAPSGAKVGAPWPDTPWTLIRRAQVASPSERHGALARLVELYHPHLVRFFGRALRLGTDDAEDCAQGLVALLLERDFARGLTHETSFRSFLKLACRRYLTHQRDAAASRSRLLRRWAERLAAAGALAPPVEVALDAAIDDELRRALIEEARERVRRELTARGKHDLLAVFEARTRFDGERPEPYRALAERFGKRVFEIRNHLTAARKLFRRELLRIAAERADDPRAELGDLGLARYLR